MASDLTREQLRAAAEKCEDWKASSCVGCPMEDSDYCARAFARAYLAAERRVAELEAQAKGGELGPMPWRLQIAAKCLADMAPSITDSITIDEATGMALSYADALLTAHRAGGGK